MSDLISRQALCEYALNQKNKSVTPNDIMRFPPAQPEKRTEERTETHACDCISRQEVIDTVHKIIYGFFSDEYGVMTDTEKTLMSVSKAVCNGVRQLPSAQQERETAKFIRWMEIKKTDEYISYTPHCKCSKCGTEFLIEIIKYCYMCGARMEEEK